MRHEKKRNQYRQVKGTYKYVIVRQQYPTTTKGTSGTVKYLIQSVGRYKSWFGLGKMVERSAFVSFEECSYGGDTYWNQITFYDYQAAENFVTALSQDEVGSPYLIQHVVKEIEL